MNRLQKKCFIASAGLHLLLVVILIVGPAFLTRDGKVDDTPTLEFIPVTTTDSDMSNRGSPASAPPASPVTPPPQPEPVTPPAQPEPQPRPQPLPKPVEPVRAPEPAPPKIERPSPDAFEPIKPKKHTVEISDSDTQLKTSADAKALAASAAAKRAAKEKAEARRRAAEFSHALASLKGNLSPSTSIELQDSGGGSGVSYGNFLAAVKKVYTDEWNVPDGVSSDAAATVSVTIARDGTVISARIIKSSENDAVDRSVQTVLDHVKFAAPLPEDAKEDQRTVNIVFDVKSKLIG